ncbi:MAG: hypothetical protein B1H04_02325 [Planctomycetales bacterium 4484_123]|nr:MAG: hypothetical protein B1H04_02325 [Planctomycetales bacterium 4484_123]
MGMNRNPEELLKRVLDLAGELLDAHRIELAKRRQGDMFAWRGSDYVPMVFAVEVEALADLGDFDWAEQFAQPAASLYMQMKGVVQAAASGSDYVPTVRADTGVINGPSILGAPYATPAHTKPVCTGHVPKEQLAEFQVPQDVSHLGVMPTMVEHTQHHLSALRQAGLGDLVGLRHCDTQGPLDIAAQARGHDELFLDMYADPAFVHELMDKCVAIYHRMNLLCKSLAGEPIDRGYANEYWMDSGSVRLCDDSGILISAEQFETFCEPYVRRAFEPFGGGWLHYCGGVPSGGRPEGLHLHDIYCRIDGLRGLNFTTGKDWPAEVRKVIERQVVYIGTLPRGEGESLTDYFRRVLALCPPRRGMIFSPQLRPGEHAQAMDTWHRLQDELWD